MPVLEGVGGEVPGSLHDRELLPVLRGIRKMVRLALMQVERQQQESLPPTASGKGPWALLSASWVVLVVKCPPLTRPGCRTPAEVVGA